jgi:hypothetical protein
MFECEVVHVSEYFRGSRLELGTLETEFKTCIKICSLLYSFLNIITLQDIMQHGRATREHIGWLYLLVTIN